LRADEGTDQPLALVDVGFGPFDVNVLSLGIALDTQFAIGAGEEPCGRLGRLPIDGSKEFVELRTDGGESAARQRDDLP
jgi:hypothetical protein